jgi:hypothetical protein
VGVIVWRRKQQIVLDVEARIAGIVGRCVELVYIILHRADSACFHFPGNNIALFEEEEFLRFYENIRTTRKDRRGTRTKIPLK